MQKGEKKIGTENFWNYFLSLDNNFLSRDLYLTKLSLSLTKIVRYFFGNKSELFSNVFEEFLAFSQFVKKYEEQKSLSQQL